VDVAGVEVDLLHLHQGSLELDLKITQLYEQMRSSVYRYLVLITGNSAEAEEITQDVFLQLYRCLLDGQNVRNVRAWIFRVAHNCAINRTASRKYFVPMDAEIWDRITALRSDPGLDPEQLVLEEEKHLRLLEAFRSLSSLQQQCLLLRAEGFRYEHIAGVVGASISNVAQSLHRGIRKLMSDRHE
jgi:RNA polymerase sigma-70 factor (ECF subfamily)